MKTQDEIIERYRARAKDDLFGFEVHEYLRALTFENAKEFLNPDAVESDWEAEPNTYEHWLKTAKEYMNFAWDKANSRRGISANRSIEHYIAWLWLADEDLMSQQVEKWYDTQYHHYGKPILRAICEHYGWEWRSLDDGVWVGTYGSEVAAADVPSLEKSLV